MDNSVLMIVVLFVLVLAFSVAAYFSTRGWYVSHVLLLAAVFLACIVFMILGAAALKTRDRWQREYSRLDKELQAEQQSINVKRYGDPTQVEPTADSLPHLGGELDRAVLDRGRVWRNLTPQGIQNNQVTIGTKGWGDDRCATVGIDEVDGGLEPEPENEGQPAVKPHNIAENTIVYLFQETSLSELDEATQSALFPDSDLPLRDTQGVCKVPSQYLGVFNVMAVTPESVTLQPTLPLDATQTQSIQAQQGTWALYELMPVDAHDIWSGVTEEQLKVLIRQEGSGLSDDAYAALLEEYNRDGTEGRDSDPPERKGVKVKFLKDHSVDVDAEAGEAGQAGLSDQRFNTSGQAVSSPLRQGGPTEFVAGDEVVVDSETGRMLIEKGICERVQNESIYMRRLRDYAYDFHQLALRLESLNDQIAVVERDTKTVEDAHTKAQSQIQSREEEKQKLQADLVHWEHEVEQLTQYLTELKDQRQKQRERLSHLYRANNLLAAQLLQLQQQAAE